MLLIRTLEYEVAQIRISLKGRIKKFKALMQVGCGFYDENKAAAELTWKVHFFDFFYCLKTYLLLIIVEAHAISCVASSSVSVRQ